MGIIQAWDLPNHLYLFRATNLYMPSLMGSGTYLNIHNHRQGRVNRRHIRKAAADLP